MSFLEKLPVDIRHRLEKYQIETPKQILCLPKCTLEKCELTSEDIQLLKLEAAKCMKTSFVSAKETLNNINTKWKRLSFGCESLDLCTQGGVLTRGITEICGESGSGKTQLSLQLSLMVQLPSDYGGFAKSAIYICTEQPFPSKRLFQLIETFKTKYHQCHLEYGKNVFVEHIVENENLLNCIINRVPKLMESKEIGLIVIDSVAAIYRIESNYIQRAKNMTTLAKSLLQIVNKYECAVICINQVASLKSNDSQNQEIVAPCLGMTWANLVRTRLKISKCPSKFCNNSRFPENQLRKFEILFTPDGNCENCMFALTSEGIQNIC